MSAQGVGWAKTCFNAQVKMRPYVSGPHDSRPVPKELIERKRIDRIKRHLQLQRDQRKCAFWAGVLVSLPLTMLGTAWVIAAILSGLEDARRPLQLMAFIATVFFMGIFSLIQNFGQFIRSNKRIPKMLNEIEQSPYN